MGRAILIYGRSGSGKSRSLKNFGKDEIALFNTIGKDLPFRGKFKYEIRSDKYEQIKKALKTMPVKTAVVDDAGYLQTNHFMRNHSTPKYGGDVYSLYNTLADNFWDLFRFVKDELPGDVNVYIMMHELKNDYGDTKLRTIGKLLDEKVCIEGMVTNALRCMVEGTRHFFRTQSDGTDISKSPEDMFPLEIENDLKLVDDTIRKFYEE